jgi:hypothetical protein
MPANGSDVVQELALGGGATSDGVGVGAGAGAGVGAGVGAGAGAGLPPGTAMPGGSHPPL